jgi:hypothetical protein
MDESDDIGVSANCAGRINEMQRLDGGEFGGCDGVFLNCVRADVGL